MSQNCIVNSENSKVINSKSLRSYGTNEKVQYKSITETSEDIIEATIGNFGRWQCRISILLSLLKLPLPWIQLGIVFLAPPTEFWCKPSREYENMPIERWKMLIDVDSNKFKSHSSLTHGNCMMWNPYNGSVIPCAWGYDYNTSVIHSSIITEWDLVCGRAHLVELSQIVLMFGVLIGSIWLGLAADKFGRRKILNFSISLQAIFGIVVTFLPWYSAFVIVRFFSAIADGGITIISFVLCMEVVGGIWRTIVPILHHIPFGLGYSLMSLIAYFLRDWRPLQLTLSVLSAFFVVYIWILPESPRWLCVVGKKEEAIELLEKAADINNSDKSKISQSVNNFNHVNKLDSEKNLGLSLLLSTPEIRTRTILLSISSLISGMNFYGFSQYIGQISTNIYFAVFVGGLLIIPGSFLCILVVSKYGRRLSIATANCFIAFCFFGICLFPLGAFERDWPRILFAGSGVIGMSVAYPALYLFIGELFPTVLRNAGVGVTVMFSKFGSMLAPVILTSGELAEFVPLLIFGFVSILQAGLVLPLPETVDCRLPDTIDDVEIFNSIKRNGIKNEYQCTK